MSDATFVYDDDCGFCTWWANRFADHAPVRTVGFSELTGEMRKALPEDYESCSHLLIDGEVHSCGASIEQAILRSRTFAGARPLVAFLRNFEGYAKFRERAYREVANRRQLWGRVISATPPGASGSKPVD